MLFMINCNGEAGSNGDTTASIDVSTSVKDSDTAWFGCINGSEKAACIVGIGHTISRLSHHFLITVLFSFSVLRLIIDHRQWRSIYFYSYFNL